MTNFTRSFPVRCPICGTKINVVPCVACAARQESAVEKSRIVNELRNEIQRIEQRATGHRKGKNEKAAGLNGMALH